MVKLKVSLANAMVWRAALSQHAAPLLRLEVIIFGFWKLTGTSVCDAASIGWQVLCGPRLHTQEHGLTVEYLGACSNLVWSQWTPTTWHEGRLAC